MKSITVLDYGLKILSIVTHAIKLFRLHRRFLRYLSKVHYFKNVWRASEAHVKTNSVLL